MSHFAAVKRWPSSLYSYYVRPRWLFVRVETEGGVVGWGEGTLEGHTEAVQGSLKDIARRFVSLEFR